MYVLSFHIENGAIPTVTALHNYFLIYHFNLLYNLSQSLFPMKKGCKPSTKDADELVFWNYSRDDTLYHLTVFCAPYYLRRRFRKSLTTLSGC